MRCLSNVTVRAEVICVVLDYLTITHRLEPTTTDVPADSFRLSFFHRSPTLRALEKRSAGGVYTRGKLLQA